MFPLLLEIENIPAEVISLPSAMPVIRALLIASVGFPLLYLGARVIQRLIRAKTSNHIAVVARKLIVYLGTILLVASILVELGFNLSAILGAAGIASVAIGFAAQTSLSNIISGLFLYWERPFEIGDMIKVGDTLGAVLAIDLLSVKIRSLENQYIRIPNETLVKTEFTNITRFPIRRLTIPVGVAYDSDIKEVMTALQAAADANPHCLDEPAPLIVFDSFGDSSMNFVFGPWVEKTEFLMLKNSIMKDIKEQFDARGIEIPFPQRVLHIHPSSAPITHSPAKDAETEVS
jgi:small-conductance mechanosensitive channel